MLIAALLLQASQPAPTTPLSVTSPDGAVVVTFDPGTGARARPAWRLRFRGVPVLADSPLGLDFAGATPLDRQLDVTATARRLHDSTWVNAFGPRRAVPDRFRELRVSLRERVAPNRRVDVILRAYDEGAALRYEVPAQPAIGKFTLAAEETGFVFARPAWGYALDMGRFNTHNEGPYTRVRLRDLKRTATINLPLLVEMPGGPWAAILEADLTSYAGMYLGGTSGDADAVVARLSFPPSRKSDEPVVGTTPFATPWRVVLLASVPGQLIEHNYLTLNLSAPSAIGDASWVKPGKAAWDWWSGSFARKVAFKPGMNTATMKHYVDFAARHHLEYMLVDAGWYHESTDREQGSFFETNPDVNIPEVIDYAKSKGVSTLLWVEWRTLNRQLHEGLAQFAKWGAAGIKIDYMNRDDQEMVNLYETWLRAAAEHHLTVDYHGAYKPTGLQRTYPNLLTREGVMGMEWSKWSELVTPEYDVTIPFTRMLAGPMDFTPGGFRNAARGRFRALDIEPMTQGTRAHQLAMYVVYESPLVMVSDHPEAYEGQPGLEFIERVPQVFDDTRVLAGEPGRFVAVARQKDGVWYIGGMTNWEARTLSLPLAFLGSGDFDARVFSDGPQAHEDGTSLSIATLPVRATEHLELKLAPGGGAAVILTPRR